ncbi:MAG TPA: AarF/ABC1/UbiB kinase family protein [Phycisphaerae bacterium]|nr:AarF/ABC1/UbiB kinase family protein [Phycisphaerae bacterium]HOI54138.1 AarF/ABC1/UbiB kinase family protein [Phycisphaerae bacterium]
MSIFSFGQTIRSSQRLATILTVLARHGFGHLVVSMRLERLVPFRQKLTSKFPPKPVGQDDIATVATRAAEAMEDLGPTFVKLGQSLAGRPDLLPVEFQNAFRRLHDRVRPFAFDEVRRVVDQDLGRPLGEAFTTFEETPFACGSIAQAHRAVTTDGRKVVVKVKRPGIERIIVNDVALLRTLAQLVDRHLPELRPYRPQMLVDEFARTLHRELDFINEASVTARFHEAFASNENVQTPQVLWQLSSHNILTLEQLSGTTVSPTTDYGAAGLDRKLLATHLLDAFFHQFFEMGIFHADPHPGNLLAQAPGRWGIIDFGQVGRLDPSMRSRLAICLVSAVNRELDLVIDILDDLGALPEEIDYSRLRNDLGNLLDKYYGTPIKRINIASVFEEIVGLARDHRIVLPRDFVLLGKSLTNVGGVALMLDPDCAPVEVIKPKLNKLMLERLSPGRIASNLSVNAYHVASIMQQGPQMFRRFFRNLMRGKMRLVFRHDGLDAVITELDRSSNRIAFSVITAAIILGSSIILQARIGPSVGNLIPWFAAHVPSVGEIPLLGLVGFVMAAVSGTWVVISILRSGRL